MMPLQGPAQRLAVTVGESNTVKHHPLYTEIVQGAHAAGIIGATAFRGIEGYAANSRVRTTRILSLAEDLPVPMVLIDAAERITAFLPELEEIVAVGRLLEEGVQAVHHPRPATQ